MKETATSTATTTTTGPDLKTLDLSDSTGAVVSSENDLKTHDPFGSAIVEAAGETELKTHDRTGSTAAEAHAAVPGVITDAEAPIAAKAKLVVIDVHEMSRGQVGKKTAAHTPATIEGGSISSNMGGWSDSGLPATRLRRQQQGVNMSRPGAFDVPGRQGGQSDAEELSNDATMPVPRAATPPNPPDNTGLAVAAPVRDPDDLEDARVVVPEEEQAKLLEKKKQTHFWIAIGALTVCALVMFVIIFVVVQNEKVGSTTNSTMASGTSAPMQPSEVLMTLLREYTLGNLPYNSTSQGRAFEWVIQDPNFESYSDKRLQQRFALATFYYSTNGEEWGPNWLNRSKHECQWEYYMPSGDQYDTNTIRYSPLKYIDGPCVPLGVDVDNSTAVTATSIVEHDDYLYLAFNMQPLTGVLPQEITMLTNLKMIQLDGTGLEGPIPAMFAEFSGLVALHIEDTLMTGTIPTEFGKLTELRTLVIGGNEGITGYLPTEIGLLSNLETLKILETNVTGPIPIEYVTLDYYEVQLSNNLMTGTIPTELGLWTRVDWMSLSGNAFTGTLPTELGNMRNIWLLYLFENLLTGTIPAELGKFEGIEQLQVNSNKLTGTIPTELAKLSDSIWRLRLDNNQLTGTLPTELGRLSFCFNMGSWGNLLTGTLPSEIAGLPGMGWFTAYGNQYSGTLPTELFSTTMMSRFWLQGNILSGSIPSEIGNWLELVELKFEDNLFMTGTIPTEVGLLGTLTKFHLGGNPFSGPLPSEIGTLAALAELTVDSTNLSGTIPMEIGYLVTNGSLTLLNLTGTPGLSGTIPDEVCGLYADPGKGYVLEFDCGPLCGCTSCPCHNVSVSNTIVVIATNDSIAERKVASL